MGNAVFRQRSNSVQTTRDNHSGPAFAYGYIQKRLTGVAKFKETAKTTGFEQYIKLGNTFPGRGRDLPETGTYKVRCR